MTPISNDSFAFTRQPLTKQEQKSLEAEQAEQAKQAERKAASSALIERSQDAYINRQANDDAQGKSSIPTPPSVMALSLSAAGRAEMMSQEYSEARAAKARQLPDLREAAALADKKTANVWAALEEAQAELTRMDALVGTSQDKVDARLSMRQKVQILSEDYHRLGQQAGQAGAQVRLAEGELKDGLVEWAESGREYCQLYIPILQERLSMCNEILELKASEVETGKCHPGAKPRAEIARGKKSPAPPLPANFTDMGTFRNNPR